MFKVFIFILICLSCSAYYAFSFHKEPSVGNSHTLAAKQFWYEQKKLLKETGNTTLPIITKIKTLDYYIGKSSLEGGTYYFSTLLVLNGQEIRLDTAVKPNEGNWEVDIKESFMGAHLSSLDALIEDFIKSQKLLNSTLSTEFLWGIGEGYSEQNEAYLKTLISKRLRNTEERIIDLYRGRSQEKSFN
jgi:hypothetical protein